MRPVAQRYSEHAARMRGARRKGNSYVTTRERKVMKRTLSVTISRAHLDCTAKTAKPPGQRSAGLRPGALESGVAAPGRRAALRCYCPDASPSAKLSDQPIQLLAINAAHGQSSSVLQYQNGVAVEQRLPFLDPLQVHQR